MQKQPLTMGIPKHVRAARDQRSQKLWDGVTTELRSASIKILDASECGRKRREKFPAFWQRIKDLLRDHSKAEPCVALYKCTHPFQGAFEGYMEWLECGVILVEPNGVHMLHVTSAVESEVASMRVLMNKLRASGVDLLLCAVCEDSERSVACRRCWSGVCRACFAACALHASDSTTWHCPGCRAPHGMGDMAVSMPHTLTSTGSCKPFQVVARVMRDLGVKSTQISLQATLLPDEGSESDSERCTPEAHRCMFKATLGKNGRVDIHSKRARFMAKLLHAPDTVFVVGEVPMKCECCDEIAGGHGDRTGGSSTESGGSGKKAGWVGEGRVFIVEGDGVIHEMDGMFGCMAAYVRTWLDGAAGESE